LPPGPRLREMIQLIHHIWDVWQHGTRPGFEGKFYQFSLMTPFFAPGPIEWPKIPIYIAGVNPYICRLAGELCDGFLVHPFHSIKYLHDVVFPNAEQGLAKSGRTRKDLTYSTTAFVVTGRTRDELEKNKGPVRQQIAFYASTRTYIGILEAHGWGETCIRLNEKAAKGDWTGMASLITDEMLDVYAVQGLIDDIPDLIKKKYTGVLDRLGFYTLPGVLGDEAQRRALVAACKG
jgi:probable F420-dependent oxidoreductase